ncbi:hypothetical protein [Actinotalea sp. JY-7885]|uniref:hypothetical protein n=1 Tax=Actinotalea sp. JY-7885 TaxID=2758576 RepID=UPI0035CA1CC2
MAVIIIGILAAIAIPIFLNQKAAAYDATVRADLGQLAETLEGLDVPPGTVARAADGALWVAGVRQPDPVTTSIGVSWGVAGTTTAYCLTGFHPGARVHNSVHTAATWDAAAGGLDGTGGACTPTTTPAAFAVDVTDGGGGLNLMTDTLWRRSSVPDFTISAAGAFASYGNAPYRTVDVATPVGTRAVEVVTSGAGPRGLIIFQRSQGAWAQDTRIEEAGEVWSASIFARCAAGRPVTLGLRDRTATGAYHAASESATTCTGDWQRLARTWTVPTGHVGHTLSLQIWMSGASGSSFLVAGPQLERGPRVSAFQPTL